MNLKTALLLLLTSFTASVNAQTSAVLFAADTKPQLISKQFKFTEGPATDKKGNVFFTDQPNNQIWEYSAEGQLSLFMDNAKRSNGMYFDAKGNLISCADEQDELISISPDKKIKILLKEYQGKLMNGPNDVWIDRKTGGMYFTDPYYQREYWTRTKPDLDKQNVYYLPKGASEPIIIGGDFKQPNGITGTPDGKYLYVADIGANKTYRFTRNADGTLSNKTLFASQGSDGMTIDELGNIYLTGKGVTVYSPEGKQIAHIDIPEPWTANLCFAGKHKDQLFITASTAVYVLPMKVHGVE
ncbi:SMP-30/gluconolactonase/LRE family protein [Mucilaginibacter sp. RS28]|uniref:SMP-30/gluconolactonase/LRE family protein n=1 Tax=Mucilaginibacter straminoryzae TaxID=2932774 RepID=A0A9X1XAQ0_9SPHI|nr:SMP-30/gluconolactonase/LRE family protein [Mucilaginibacter straminoryzae]MCJ8211309.1 SMP-30/gluconolactonase/LRE family protein [Mucilaginibacter straminoryzae]